MKKIILSLIVTMFLLMGVPVSAAEEKVPVYMFSKDGCSACIAAEQYFTELESEHPDLFEVIEIVVFDGNWNAVAPERQELLIDIYERFGEDTSKASTPTIVIGDYHSVGLPQDTSLVYDAIVKVKNSKKPVDEVKKLIEKNELDLEELTQYVKMPTEETNIGENTEGGKYDTLIIIGIFVVLIGGFAGLVIIGKK